MTTLRILLRLSKIRPAASSSILVGANFDHRSLHTCFSNPSPIHSFPDSSPYKNLQGGNVLMDQQQRWLSKKGKKDRRDAKHKDEEPKNSGKHAKKKDGGAGGVESYEEFSLDDVQSAMQRSIDHFKSELASLRSGRANPGMLDHIECLAYGDKVQLKSLATVSVKDPQLLGVTCFDPETVDAVVKAIMDSPLNLNPQAAGQEIMVPIPKPTREVLEAMKKVVSKEGEKCKIGVRNARKMGMERVKGLGTEDDQKRGEKDVQKLTDKCIGEVDGILKSKEKELSQW